MGGADASAGDPVRRRRPGDREQAVGAAGSPRVGQRRRRGDVIRGLVTLIQAKKSTNIRY